MPIDRLAEQREIEAIPYTLAVDFDGVIHDMKEWVGPGSAVGGPVRGALEALVELERRGYRVVIFTARANLETVENWLREQLAERGLHLDFEVTNRKPGAFAYVDDRAHRFTNWPDMLALFPDTLPVPGDPE